MKKYISVVLATLSISAVAAPAFTDYPVGIYNGKHHKVILNADTKSHRTRFKETESKPVDFAGHYVTNQFGCGTECAMMILADARTGRTMFLGEASAVTGCNIGDVHLDYEVRFKPTSRLLIVSGGYGDDLVCETRYYVESNGKFNLIETEPFIEQTSENAL